MSYQFNLFDYGDPLLGLEVQLPYPCKGGGGDLFVVGTGRRGPHRASLNCPRCGHRRAWVSQKTADFLTSVVERSGRPNAPVVVPVPPKGRRRKVVARTEQ